HADQTLVPQDHHIDQTGAVCEVGSDGGDGWDVSHATVREHDPFERDFRDVEVELARNVLCDEYLHRTRVDQRANGHGLLREEVREREIRVDEAHGWRSLPEPA